MLSFHIPFVLFSWSKLFQSVYCSFFCHVLSSCLFRFAFLLGLKIVKYCRCAAISLQVRLSFMSSHCFSFSIVLLVFLSSFAVLSLQVCLSFMSWKLFQFFHKYCRSSEMFCRHFSSLLPFFYVVTLIQFFHSIARFSVICCRHFSSVLAFFHVVTLGPFCPNFIS